MGDEAPNTNTHAPGTVRRRDVVVGAVAGLLGLGGGTAVGRMTAPTPGPKPGEQPPFPDIAQPSFAQCGEDLLLAFLCRHFKIERPTYLDIGTWEPVRANNTYLLYLRGGRGVLVEPNPALADRIRQTRPEDKLLSAGIGITDAAEADYYMFNEEQLNTFDADEVKRILAQPHLKLEKTVKVPLVNINRAIGEHLGGRAPDVLSIDIEGLDLAVLKTLDFTRYRPKLICAETLVVASLSHNPDTTPFLAGHGYELRGQTFANAVYVDNKLLGK